MSNDQAPVVYSLIAPVYNEDECIAEFIQRTSVSMQKLDGKYEIILIDDGSRDNSFSIMQEVAIKDKRIRLIRFARNFGQTPALAAGIEAARGEFIITIDTDLQNPPEEIPKLINKLHAENVDVISGWRKDRQDKSLTRKFPSWCANKLVSWFSSLHLHDYGCALKVYRSLFLKDITLYGEMHRFVPALVYREGGKVLEIPVAHNERQTGVSKYGLERVEKVFLDLFLLKFLSGYATRPVHYFGKFGMRFFGAGLMVGLFAVYQRYFGNYDGIHMVPLLLLTVLLLILGVQTILMGLLAEIGIRTYHECQNEKHTYFIAEVVN